MDTLSQNFGKSHKEFSTIVALKTPLHVQLCESGLFESQDDTNAHFGQLVDYLGIWLEEQGFAREVVVLDYMLELKQGQFRKDGKSPSAIHEVSQALYFISCVEDGLYNNDPAGVLATILCHDLQEDFGISRDDMKQRLLQNGIPDDDAMERFLDDYDTISYHNGDKNNPNYNNKYDYSLSLRQRENASVAKIFDNIHNAATAVGGLTNKNLLKHQDKIMQNISLFTDMLSEDPDERIEIQAVIAQALTNDIHSKIGQYTGKIQLQLNTYVEDSMKNYPHNADIYNCLEKVVGKTIQINRHLFYNDDETAPHQPLSLEDYDYPSKGFNLPRGLHPYHVAQDRVLSIRPEIAPKGYKPPKSLSTSQDISGDKPEPAL